MTRKSSVVTSDEDDEVEGTYEEDSREEIQTEDKKEERSSGVFFCEGSPRITDLAPP